MKRPLLAYAIVLQILIVGILWKSDFLDRVYRRLGFVSPPSVEITDHFKRMLRYHERSVDTVPDGAVIFIGDSITQGLCVSAVVPNGVNYGIGSDTTAGVLQRLHVYMPALKRARYIVLAIGVNDARFRIVDDAIQNYKRILDSLPSGCKIVVSSLLPVDTPEREELDDWIRDFNSKLEEMVSKHPNVVFVNNTQILDRDSDGRLDANMHVADGVHLNSAGNILWVSNLRDAINSKGEAEQNGAREPD